MLVLLPKDMYFCLMATRDYVIQEQDILFTEDILEACSGTYNDYLLHIFITQGCMSFTLDDKFYQAQSGSGIILLQGMTLHDICLSDDIKAIVLLKSRRYHLAHPQRTPHNIKGLTYYYENPIMQMNAQDMELCLRDLDDIKNRLSQTDHIYHQETLDRSVENFVYDIFHIYSKCNSQQASKGGREALLAQQFVDLLQQYVRQVRTVEFYADKLFVTPKYLSRICLQSTGHNASYWITHFTLSQIMEELTGTDRTLTDISNDFNFPYLSHFTRYVKQHSGKTPSEYRIKK